MGRSKNKKIFLQGIIFKKIIDTSKNLKKIFVQVEKVPPPPPSLF
jgi:hypothetical protein